MAASPTKKQSLPRKIHAELSPIFVRVHTRVADEKPRQSGQGKLADKWAHFALVFDCETTTDIRQDLNFLWWRFCELKQDIYICQQEGLVYADNLDAKSIHLIRKFADDKCAQVEIGLPYTNPCPIANRFCGW